MPNVQVPDFDVTALRGVSLDSRRVSPGWLYVALPGARTHGARFAAEALAGGAIAILTDAEGATLAGHLGVPILVDDDPRAAMARIAAAVYGQPARRMAMYGVTGTAGKTSTVALVAAGLTAAGQCVGTIGTLGFRLDGRDIGAPTTTVTTPESPDLQAMLATMADGGATCVAMEVSSHALILNRVDGIRFDVAAFTNLGRDHLDFHEDMEHYYRAKASLFDAERSGCAVVNIDDPWGRRLATELTARGATLVTTSVDGAADYRASRWTTLPDGTTSVDMVTPSGRMGLRVGLLGAFGVRNALMAAAIIDQTQFDLADAAPGFAHIVIPGRMQRVALDGPAPHVVVDFAHTPDEVTAALAALPGPRRLAVVGCGGDRDRGKREPMGEAAALGADVVIVTDDNPRSEDPAAIRAAVLVGARRAAERTGAQVIDGGERRAAIRTALELAGPQDWVAVLGKGDERTQQLAGQIVPFVDAQVVDEQWQAVRADAGE